MSGLALCLKKMGYHVAGSDISDNATTARLRQAGIPVEQRHKAQNITGYHCLVTSSAIPDHNPEKMEAIKTGVPVIKRGQLLGEISKTKSTLAVTGSHGKTTLSSLLGKLLVSANRAPLIITGGVMHEYKSNVYIGDGPELVAEADESDGTHQYLHPTYGFITNIDREHMAFYKTDDALLQSFRRFLDQVKPEGAAFVCSDCPILSKLSQRIDFPPLTYGLGESAQTRVFNIHSGSAGLRFDVRFCDNRKILDLESPLVGNHNAQNMAGVLAAAFQLGLSENIIRHALKNFQGVWRRFTYLGSANGVHFVDDYAHHPTEIRATLQAARERFQGRIIAVCEPHRYTRLADLFDDFTETLSKADQIIVLPTYAAGEPPLPGISSERLQNALRDIRKEATCLEAPEDIRAHIEKNSQPDDAVIFMGAGHSSQLANTCFKIP